MLKYLMNFQSFPLTIIQIEEKERQILVKEIKKMKEENNQIKNLLLHGQEIQRDTNFYFQMYFLKIYPLKYQNQ